MQPDFLVRRHRLRAERECSLVPQCPENRKHYQGSEYDKTHRTRIGMAGYLVIPCDSSGYSKAQWTHRHGSQKNFAYQFHNSSRSSTAATTG